MADKKYIYQHRRGTEEEWGKAFQIPEVGELVLKLDEDRTISEFKFGDGVSTYEKLSYPMLYKGSNVAQVPGNSKTDVMSQKAVTDELIKISAKYNLFNKEDITQGRFTASNGSGSNNSSWCWVDIPVISGHSYSFGGARIITCYHAVVNAGANLGSSNAIDGGVDSGAYRVEVAPTNAKFVRVSCQIADLNKILVVQSDTAEYDYLPYNTVVSAPDFYCKDNIVTITVSPNDNLRTILENITDASPAKKYVILLKDGTYDIRSYYTEEEISTNGFAGLFVPSYCKLMGQSSMEKVILTWTEHTPHSKISTINTYLDSELENLTIKGENIRYAVHDDSISNFYIDKHDNPWREFKNCHFIGIKTIIAGSYGGGFRGGCKWKFDNCIFETRDVNLAPCYIHNNNGFKTAAEITFENCSFIGPDSITSSIVMSSLNKNSLIVNNVTFIGCKAQKKIYLSEDNAELYGSGLKFKVSGYGNNFDNTDVAIKVTDGVDYSSYINLASNYTPRNTSTSSRVLIMSPVNGSTRESLETFRYPTDYGLEYLGNSETQDGDQSYLRGTQYTKDYYAKRVIVGNPDLGIIMKDNRDAKVSEGLILKGYDKYFNYMDHDEPLGFAKNDSGEWEEQANTRFTIAARDCLGRFVVEDGDSPFHAINKRQLDSNIATMKAYVDQSVATTKAYVEQSMSETKEDVNQLVLEIKAYIDSMEKEIEDGLNDIIETQEELIRGEVE